MYAKQSSINRSNTSHKLWQIILTGIPADSLAEGQGRGPPSGDVPGGRRWSAAGLRPSGQGQGRATTPARPSEARSAPWRKSARSCDTTRNDDYDAIPTSEQPLCLKAMVFTHQLSLSSTYSGPFLHSATKPIILFQPAVTLWLMMLWTATHYSPRVISIQ